MFSPAFPSQSAAIRAKGEEKNKRATRRGNGKETLPASSARIAHCCSPFLDHPRMEKPLVLLGRSSSHHIPLWTRGESGGEHVGSPLRITWVEGAQ